MVIADDNTVTLHCVPGPLDLPALQYLTLSAPSVPVGDSITGTITLSGPAPAGGTFVTLTSVGGAAVVGSGVTVPEGSTSATFTVTSETQGSATVTATLAAVTLTAPLQVTDH